MAGALASSSVMAGGTSSGYCATPQPQITVVTVVTAPSMATRYRRAASAYSDKNPETSDSPTSGQDRWRNPSHNSGASVAT